MVYNLFVISIYNLLDIFKKNILKLRYSNNFNHSANSYFDWSIVEGVFTFSPDKDAMKEYLFPGELDSLCYAFIEIQNVIRL